MASPAWPRAEAIAPSPPAPRNPLPQRTKRRMAVVGSLQPRARSMEASARTPLPHKPGLPLFWVWFGVQRYFPRALPFSSFAAFVIRGASDAAGRCSLLWPPEAC